MKHPWRWERQATTECSGNEWLPGMPRIGDIRQTTAIEHAPHFVGLLHKEVSDENCVKLLIAKNNNGSLGTVRLFLSAELQRFEQGPVVYHGRQADALHPFPTRQTCEMSHSFLP
jgi:hypothetical protein